MREAVHAHDIIDIADKNPGLPFCFAHLCLFKKMPSGKMLTSATVFCCSQISSEFTGEINAMVGGLTACWIVQMSADRLPW